MLLQVSVFASLAADRVACFADVAGDRQTGSP